MNHKPQRMSAERFNCWLSGEFLSHTEFEFWNALVAEREEVRRLEKENHIAALIDWFEKLDADPHASGVFRLDSGGSGLVRICAVVDKLRNVENLELLEALKPNP